MRAGGGVGARSRSRARPRTGSTVDVRAGGRRDRGARRVGHRPGRRTRSRWPPRRRARAPSSERGSGSPRSSARAAAWSSHSEGGDSVRCRVGRQLRRARGRLGRAARRRRLVRDLSRARASSSSSIRRGGSRSSGSCCRCRPSARKGVLVFPTLDGKVVAGPTARRPRGQARLVGRARGARGDHAARRSRCTRRSRTRQPIARVRRTAPGRARGQLRDRALAPHVPRSSTSPRSARRA